MNSVYLGRPWREYGMTLFMHCDLPAQINPKGWHNWSNPANELTARYGEYSNFGEGADISQRVSWARQLTKGDVNTIGFLKYP